MKEESKIELSEMGKFILKLLPGSEVCEDGVYCDFDLLEQMTIDIIKQGRNVEIDIRFNRDDLEVCFGDKSSNFAFVLEYKSIIEEMRTVNKFEFVDVVCSKDFNVENYYNITK